MRRTQTLAVALAALLALSLVALATPTLAGSSSGTVALDDDHGLTSDSAIDEFNESGTATTTETYPNMSITVAESGEDVGLEGLRYTDFDSTYLQVEYGESIDRTVRLYIPREYWHPHPDELEAVDADVTATLEPTSGGNYTAVEMHLEDETTATFEVKHQASLVFNARDTTTEWLENETGVDLPRLDGSSDHWEYVPTEELTEDNPTFAIETDDGDVTLQYDRANTADPAEQTWRTLPECSSSAGSDAPVCWYQGEDTDRKTVLAQSSSPPDIRYHHDAGMFADARSSIGELLEMPSAVLDDARDLIDGVFD